MVVINAATQASLLQLQPNPEGLNPPRTQDSYPPRQPEPDAKRNCASNIRPRGCRTHTRLQAALSAQWSETQFLRLGVFTNYSVGEGIRNTNEILEAIDQQITQLQKARALLAEAPADSPLRR